MADNRRDDVLVEAAVAAVAAVSVPLADVEALRTNPGPGAAERPALAKALRNADEQTVAALVAMLLAAESRGWADRSYAEWGAIGCPRFLGRMVIGALVPRYYEDAKYSINPHIIPNHSLHSPSGTASISFNMHGPNFGVGGGPNHMSEGFMAALSVLSEGRVPGIWLLATEFDPEPRPDRVGKPTNAVTTHAVAMAIQPGNEGFGSLRLVRGGSAVTKSASNLAQFVSGRGSNWQCAANGLGTIELELSRS